MEVLRHGHDMPIWVKRFKVHSCLILKSEDVALGSFFSQHTAFDTTNQVIYQPFWGITPIRFASSLVVRSLPSVDLVAIRIFAVREVGATPAEVQLGRHVVTKSGCHSPTRFPGPTGTTWIYGRYIYIWYMSTCIYIYISVYIVRWYKDQLIAVEHFSETDLPLATYIHIEATVMEKQMAVLQIHWLNSANCPLWMAILGRIHRLAIDTLCTIQIETYNQFLFHFQAGELDDSDDQWGQAIPPLLYMGIVWK